MFLPLIVDLVIAQWIIGNYSFRLCFVSWFVPSSEIASPLVCAYIIDRSYANSFNATGLPKPFEELVLLCSRPMIAWKRSLFSSFNSESRFPCLGFFEYGWRISSNPKSYKSNSSLQWFNATHLWGERIIGMCSGSPILWMLWNHWGCSDWSHSRSWKHSSKDPGASFVCDSIFISLAYLCDHSLLITSNYCSRGSLIYFEMISRVDFNVNYVVWNSKAEIWCFKMNKETVILHVGSALVWWTY